MAVRVILTDNNRTGITYDDANTIEVGIDGELTVSSSGRWLATFAEDAWAFADDETGK